MVLDLGYIGDFLDDHAACCKLLLQVETGHVSPLLAAVADPQLRQLSKWHSGSVQQDTSTVAINTEQRDAVAGLAYEIEGIQGPPGTGKSTTIHWIIKTRLAPGDVALATCVQNKALGAIAEKLAGIQPRAVAVATLWVFMRAIAQYELGIYDLIKVHVNERSFRPSRVPFFVEGNPDRLDPVARHWTATAQAEYDGTFAAHATWETTLVQWRDQVAAVICAKERSGLDAPSRLLRFKNRFLAPSLADAAAGRCTPIVCRDGWKIFWGKHLATRYRAVYVLHRKLSRMCIAVAAQKEDAFRRAFGLVVRRARVVLSTVASTGALARKAELREATDRITIAILDEAGTIPESKVPMLLQLPGLRKIVAIGDEQQLPPFTHLTKQGTCYQHAETGSCSYGSRCKFGHGGNSDCVLRGFFQRLNDALPARIPTLYEQYRMHPAICSVVSDLFYGGMLRTPQRTFDQRLAADPRGLWCVHVNGTEAHPEHGGTSYINMAEVRSIMKAFQRFKHKTVMVITFYKAQFFALRNAFADVGINQGPRLRICTVDQSQGGEADVVLLSTVRSNPIGQLGFVDSPHRINVAISRAREALVIVGDSLTLRASHHLGKVWDRSYPLDWA